MVTTAANGGFVDTNLLVTASTDRFGRCAAVLQSPSAFSSQTPELCISRQVLREYLSVFTRPQTTSTPVAMSQLIADVRAFEQRFRILEESPSSTAKLLDLLTAFPTSGRQVHDANIIATMLANGITELATENEQDFKRFEPHITPHII